MVLVLLAILLLFGAKRIPEVARAVGKGMADFRDAMSGVERELKGEPPAHSYGPIGIPAPRPRRESWRALPPGAGRDGPSLSFAPG